MAYCSIEEAWGPTFNNNKKKIQNIVPDNANNESIEYSGIDFENDNVYTRTGKPQLCKKKSRTSTSQNY